MARVSIEAFISLEASLGLRLSTTANEVFQDTYAAIESAMAEKDWPVATRLAKTLDYTPVFDINLDYIRYVSQVSLLFGASRLSRDAKTSIVGMGFEGDTVDQVVQSLRIMIVTSATEQLQQSAMQLISLRKEQSEPVEKSEEPYLGLVLKAGKPSAVLPFTSFMNKEGKSFFNMASSLHTSRLSAFGFTAEANYLGITEYQITEQLDGRTCPVCALMHGKTFRVSDARALLDLTIRTQDPDELKGLQPWPSQSSTNLALMQAMSAEDLVTAGWHVPPFHPRCRGLLTKVGTVPKLVPGQKPEPVPEVYEATQEDFEQLGIKLTPQKVETWNSIMQTAPSQVIANLSGMQQAKVLELAQLAGDDPMAAVGLVHLKVTPTKVNVELNTHAHGSKKPVHQDYYFKADTASVGSVDFHPEDTDTLKPLLKALVGTTKATTAKQLTLLAGDTGGWAWAKFGLTPFNWGDLRNQVRRRITTTPEILKGASATELKALNAILDSDDAMDVFALADLPTLGKKLMEGTGWEGKLDFLSPEAMARFAKETK